MDVLSLYAAFLSKSAGNSGDSAEEKPEPLREVGSRKKDAFSAVPVSWEEK